MLKIETATLRHAESLAQVMRPEDIAEVRSSDDWSPIQALAESLRKSEEAWSVFVDGEIAAMYGVSTLSMLGGVGAVWMLTGPALEKHPLAVLRACQRLLPDLLIRHHVLINAIDARYSKALKWAKWLGFELGECVRGQDGTEFYTISLKRGDDEWAQ